MTTDYTQTETHSKIGHKNSLKSQLTRPQQKKTLSGILKNAKPVTKSLSNVYHLKTVKSKLELLPSKAEYQLYLETDYLRNISEVLPLLQFIRMEQIPFIISVQTFKKIAIQLERQTQHKQIVLCLIKQIAKGFQQYASILNEQIYDCLQFIIQIDSLPYRTASKLDSKSSEQELQKEVLRQSIIELVESIVKWYSISSQGRQLSTKYERLLQKMMQTCL